MYTRQISRDGFLRFGFPIGEAEMANKNSIYDKLNRTWHEVPPKTYAEYMKYCSNFRKRQQRNGTCICPRHHWWMCDTLCHECIYSEPNEITETDAFPSHGREEPFFNQVSDASPIAEEMVNDAEELSILFARLEKLIPQARQIARMKSEGMTVEQISGVIGIPRTTLLSRMKKAAEILSHEFPERF